MTDPLTASFWDAARNGQLMIQRCLDCGRHQFYPRPFCLVCESQRVAPTEASGGGIVYSLTVVHISTDPSALSPYAVGLIELDEGPRLLGRLTSTDLSIGDRVALHYPVQTPYLTFEPAVRRVLR